LQKGLSPRGRPNFVNGEVKGTKRRVKEKTLYSGVIGSIKGVETVGEVGDGKSGGKSQE